MSFPSPETSDRREAKVERPALGSSAPPSSRMAAQQKMAGKISHDVNNYLTVFLGYGELLQGVMGDDERGRKYLAEMLRAAARAAEYIRQLQAFGGRQVADVEVVDLNAFLEGLLPVLRTALGEDLDLSHAFEPGLPAVDIDPAHFQQILGALAAAAREAVTDKGVFRLETQRAAANGTGRSAVLLHVIDSSGAVPDEGGERLFEPFATGDGRSLDLAAAYGTIVQHGGAVGATLLANGHRCVTIRIPAGGDV